MLYEWAGSEGLSLTDNDGFNQRMEIFEYNCENRTHVLDHLLSTTEYLSCLGINWQYKMCNDGGGESSGHMTSLHQPFTHLLNFFMFSPPI